MPSQPTPHVGQRRLLAGTRTTPMASTRIEPGRDPVLPHPVRGELAQGPQLGVRDRLQRMPEPQPAAALDLAEDQRDARRRPVRGDDVDLAPPAAPVAGQHRQPLTLQLAHARSSPRRPTSCRDSVRTMSAPPHGKDADADADRPGSPKPVETRRFGRLWTAEGMTRGHGHRAAAYDLPDGWSQIPMVGGQASSSPVWCQSPSSLECATSATSPTRANRRRILEVDRRTVD